MDKLHEQLERLHAQYDEISDDDDDDDDTQADATAKAIATLESQLEALQQQQDAITQAQEFVSPEVAALAGAVVYIDANGQVHVGRNRVRLADARAATRAATKAGADAAGAGAGGATHATDHKGAVSDKLCRQLTAHRTRALQAALLGNECVALAALVHPLLTRLVSDLRATWHSPSVLQVTTQYCETQLQACAPDLAGMRSDQVVTQALKDARAMLPADPAELLPWLLVQHKDTLTRLLTLCAALSVNAIGKGQHVGAQAIAQAVKLDMADWWVPTAESYLNAVPKAQIVQAVAEAGMSKDAHNLAKLKKAQVVAAAQGLLAGKRWLPALLR